MGLQAAWPTLRPELKRQYDELITQLVTANNDETRGRIKQLAELLELPNTLQREAEDLQQPQQEAELP